MESWLANMSSFPTFNIKIKLRIKRENERYGLYCRCRCGACLLFLRAGEARDAQALRCVSLSSISSSLQHYYYQCASSHAVVSCRLRGANAGALENLSASCPWAIFPRKKLDITYRDVAAGLQSCFTLRESQRGEYERKLTSHWDPSGQSMVTLSVRYASYCIYYVWACVLGRSVLICI